MRLKQAAAFGGFAMVDLETTGLYSRTDHVVEAAVVHLSADGQITGEFSTLINPGRDVGPTRIHGIRAADVLHGPAFADAASTIWQLLSGHVLVAHNVPFDARFLEAEFNRCGARMPPPPVMCTMQLASYYLANLPGRNLAACCAAANIPKPRWHSALDDARAAARLLACYRAAHRQLPRSWDQALGAAALASWMPAPGYAEFRPLPRGQQSVRVAAQRPPLADLVDRLPRGTSAEVDAYLAVLDRVLEDRIVTDDEAAELSALAAELGLTRDSAFRAHREYLIHVATAAWCDRKITDLERTDLREVAGLLGDMTTSREEIMALAAEAGLRVTSSVSAQTALLVAADPWSQSGKANLARQLGVRIITEQVFLYYLEQILADTKGSPDPGVNR